MYYPKDSKNLFMGKNGKKYNPKPPLSIISILLIKHERDRRNFPISANPPKMNLWNLFKFVSSRLKTAKIPPSLLYRFLPSASKNLFSLNRARRKRRRRKLFVPRNLNSFKKISKLSIIRSIDHPQ